MLIQSLLCTIYFFHSVFSTDLFKLINENDKCALDTKLIEEISSYQPIVNNIINELTKGQYKGKAYEALTEFVDRFGSRIAGSKALENAIDYMVNMSLKNNFFRVHTEPVQVPHWVRGKERAVATLVPYARDQELSILALGGSVGTPIGGLKAETIVVRSFHELRHKANKAAGKIVVFAPEWVNYDVTVKYRLYGAVEAAKVGGIASLIRSVTPFSIYSPHTGLQKYDENVVKIPTACITVEDAEMLLRLYRKGIKVEIFLEMEMQNLPPVISRNTVIDTMGRSNPYDIVLISGHLDSWDVGNGAMDDGGGAFISWYSALFLKNLGLIPRRTIRTVLWTGEEEGFLGASEYRRAHSKEMDNFTLLMESDMGTFDPQGITFKGSKQAQCIMQEILKLFSELNATQLDLSEDVGTDIMVWKDDGIPLAGLKNDNERYFWFHHTKGDTMTVESPDSMDKSTAVCASIAYIIADLSVKFPR